MISCNFLVIGAGEAGICTALKLAKFGSDVVLVEENEIGGSWLYSLEYPFLLWGKEIKKAGKIDLEKLTETELDVLTSQTTAINNQIQQKLDQKQDEIINNLKEVGVKIVYGKAGFISKSMVEVNSENEHEIINFKQAIICVGKNQINMPELAGIEEVDFLYQHNVFSINQVPKTLGIIGCSIFNLEIAYLYSKLGTKIHIFEDRNIQQILRFFDSTCLNWTFRELLKKNVSFHFETKINKVASLGDKVKLFDNKKNNFLVDRLFIFAKESFEGDKIAISKTGIKFDKNGIVASQNGQTVQRNIYAVGNSSQNKKNNLHSVLNNLCQNFAPSDEKKTNSIVLFGASNKNNFETNKIRLGEPVFSLGMSYREAETRWGAVIQFEIYKSFFDSGFVKITYNSVNGQVLGIGLCGGIAQNFYSAMAILLSKNTNQKEVKNFLLDNGLNLE